VTVPARSDSGDPGWDVRASNAERNEVVDLLRDQLGDGRLELAEFEERTATAMVARTRGELVPLFHDLPVRWPAPPPPSRVPTRPLSRPAGAGTKDKKLRSFVALWVALMVLWWGIWLAVGMTGGSWFPWPIFPSLGMGVPVLIRVFRRLLGLDDD